MLVEMYTTMANTKIIFTLNILLQEYNENILSKFPKNNTTEKTKKYYPIVACYLKAAQQWYFPYSAFSVLYFLLQGDLPTLSRILLTVTIHVPCFISLDSCWEEVQINISLADPGKARGCSTNTGNITSLNHWAKCFFWIFQASQLENTKKIFNGFQQQKLISEH